MADSVEHHDRISKVEGIPLSEGRQPILTERVLSSGPAAMAPTKRCEKFDGALRAGHALPLPGSGQEHMFERKGPAKSLWVMAAALAGCSGSDSQTGSRGSAVQAAAHETVHAVEHRARTGRHRNRRLHQQESQLSPAGGGAGVALSSREGLRERPAGGTGAGIRHREL